MPPARRSLVAALTALALVASCTASHHRRAASTGASTGASPAPSASLPSSSASRPATQPPQHADTPDSLLLAPPAVRPRATPPAAAALLAQQAAGAGPTAQGALRTALALSGVDVIDVGGGISDAGDEPKLGVQVPAGEVLMMSGQNTGEHGTTVADFTAALAAVIGRHAAQAPLRRALLDGIRNQASTGVNDYPATTQFLAAFIEELGRDAHPSVDLATAGTANVRLTGLQSWLLWLGVAGAMAQAGALVRAGRPAPSPSPAGFAAAPACTAGDTVGRVLTTSATSPSAWGGLAGLVRTQSAVTSGPFGATRFAAWAELALSLAQVIAESTAFTATFELAGGEPLVRTRQTGQDGNQKTVDVHAEFHLRGGQYANCIRTALNALRPGFVIPTDGAITGAAVRWGVLDAATSPVRFRQLGPSTGAGSVTETDARGDSAIGLQAVRQAHALRAHPAPYLRQVSIVVGLHLDAAVRYPELAAAASTLRAGPGALTALLEHTHPFSAQTSVSVQDWH